MEILHNFGFEPALFVAQIINFLILAFIFKKFLYKPILKAIKDRQNQIARGIEDAENARVSLEEAETKKDEIIRAATLEAEKIIQETKKSAESIREEMVASAKSEADRITAESKIAAEEETKHARLAAEGAAVELSKNLLEKILDKMFTKAERQKIIQRNVQLLEKYD